MMPDAKCPVGKHDLILDEPASFWSCGTIMGNGYLGAMAWGTPERFYFSVNRHDVWDYRCPAKPVVPGVPWKKFVELVATRQSCRARQSSDE